MSNKVRVVIDSNNPNFPRNGSPIDLNGVSSVVMTDLENFGGINVVIHQIGGEIAGYLPSGKIEKITIPVDRNMLGLFFIGIEVPANATAIFDYQLIMR